jgi:integrase
MTTQKKDLFRQESRYKEWKDKVKITGIFGISKENSNLIRDYIFDMEIGANVSNKSKKGSRSYGRLIVLKQKMIQLTKFFEKRDINDLTKIEESELLSFFSDMRNGYIQKEDGGNYKSVHDFIKIFKAFWHWRMKKLKKQNTLVHDITEDLDCSSGKQPDFVYITKEQLWEYINFYDIEDRLYFTEEEKTCILFCFDSIVRSPTELFSILVSNLYPNDNELWINVPDEISKTFGRSFNLLYSKDMLIKHIVNKRLSSGNYLFNLDYEMFRRKMQNIAVKLFGNCVSDIRAGGRWENITLYDLRHSGTIHLRILAKQNPFLISLDAIRERGGWTDFKMINYYTKRIGIDGYIPFVSIRKDPPRFRDMLDLTQLSAIAQSCC